MPRKKRVKKVTVTELQSYIKGAIEFNADDWCPNKTQWDKIVEMLMNLKSDDPRSGVVNGSEWRGTPSGGEDTTSSGAEIHRQTSETESNMYVEYAGDDFLHSDKDEGPTKLDMRKVNVETSGPIGRDERGVVTSGKRFKGPSRDDSTGLTESEYL
jgi:hypothetical protein